MVKEADQNNVKLSEIVNITILNTLSVSVACTMHNPRSVCFFKWCCNGTVLPTMHSLGVENIVKLSLDGKSLVETLCTFKFGMWTSGEVHSAAGLKSGCGPVVKCMLQLDSGCASHRST